MEASKTIQSQSRGRQLWPGATPATVLQTLSNDSGPLTQESKAMSLGSVSVRPVPASRREAGVGTALVLRLLSGGIFFSAKKETLVLIERWKDRGWIA